MKDFDFESRLFLAFANAALVRGLDPTKIAAKNNMPWPLKHAQDSNPENQALHLVTTPISSLAQFGDDLARALGDEHFGLHAAQMVPSGAYGVAEFLIRSSPTVKGAFENFVRYSQLLAPGQSYRFSEGPRSGTSEFHHHVTQNSKALGRHFGEFGNAIFVNTFRSLCQSPIRSVWFTTPAPASTEKLRHFFQSENLTFDAPTNGFSFDSVFLEQLTPKGDASLFQFLEEHAQAALAKRPTKDPLINQLHENLRLALQNGEPNIERLAMRMQTSARTLQRKLGSLNTTFQNELDAVRHALAKQYLSDVRLDLTQVAYLLGYSEVRAFERAFNRWSGTSPAQFRNKTGFKMNSKPD